MLEFLDNPNSILYFNLYIYISYKILIKSKLQSEVKKL